ncbi:MAG: type III-B CRISPR module RAMP protein Cmr4 [Opitutales bacterium]|nr:type III-B CRISPR module RAMP protein Cmr4 [Opitutales bacterium]
MNCSKEINTMYIFTRTPLHIGCGNDIGTIDSPVQRNRTTDCPIIPGSAIKGVLKDALFNAENSELWGRGADSAEDAGAKAGLLSFTEANLLLFPLRSLNNGYAFATSPFLLKKFFSLTKKTGLEIGNFESGTAAASEKLVNKNKIILEEYSFAAKNDPAIQKISELIGGAIPEDPILKSLKDHLVILSDEDMFYFVKFACPVQQHVRIGDDGIAVDGALFNLEVVPSETLFYSLIMGDKRDLDKFNGLVRQPTLIQFGGDSSTGLGFSIVNISK